MGLEERYEFLEKVGAGSFATVYRARDLELGREVAVKQIHQQYLDDPKQLERYWQEAQLLASLGHPNIVTIFDIHRDRGWLILELMQASLAERMAGRQMDLRALRATLAHGLRALKYLHSRGIIHGDIKLSNLMIDHRRRVKIGDFGLARRASDDEGSLLKGTTKYMAPEVVSDEFGQIGPPSDLYSLGFCAYELLCGPNFESLFPGLSAFGRNKQVAWMMWHAAADRRLPEISRVLQGVPDDLAHVIQRLIEKDQSKRYRTADEALSDLKVDVKLVKTPGGDADVLDDAPDDAARRKRLRVAAIGFGVSLLVCVLLLLLPGGGSSGDGEPRTLVRVVTEVYPDKNELKVEDLDHQFASRLELGETPHIFFTNTGRNITLDELEPGDRIEVERRTDTRGRPVLKVRAARPVPNRGRIRRIERATREVTITIEDGPSRGEQTMRVPERAAITLNGHSADLRLLNDDDPVEVTHLAEIGDRPGRVVARLDVRRLAPGMGFVTAVDAEQRRLTVNIGTSARAESLELPLAEDCRITLDGEQVALEALEPQDLVRFRYDVVFREINVERGQTLSGLVREVRSGSRELVISTAAGDERTLAVAADADVTLNQTPARFEDLRAQKDMVDLTLSGDGDGAAVSAILARRAPIHDRWAVVVGIDDYEDRNLTPLEHAVDDARLVREALVTRYACPPERLKLLIDSTRDELRAGLEEVLAAAAQQTQVIVYVACHAYLDEDGRVYLAGRNFRIDETAATGLPLEWVVERFESCSARDKLLLLDCSHSGNGSDLARQPSTEEMLRTVRASLKTTVAVASCSAGERGLDLAEHGQGLFAWSVARGFSGEADADRNLRLTADELFEYLKSAMPAASPAGRKQTPAVFGAD